MSLKAQTYIVYNISIYGVNRKAIVLFKRFQSIRVHWAPIQYNNYPRNYLYAYYCVCSHNVGSSFLIYMDADFGNKNEQMHLFITSNLCVLYTHMSV